MDILRGNTVIATIHPADDSVYSCKLMGDNALKLNFRTSTAVALLICDHIVYNSATFTLNIQPTAKETSTREFEYNCEFQSADYELKKVEYRLFDNTPVPPQGDFSLIGTARTFMQLLVDNMNRVQSGWTLGTVLDTEFKTLTFSSEDCLTVINTLAKEFFTEFYISGSKVINLQQKPFTGTVLTLGYGQGNGLKSLTKLKNDTSDLITSLYVLGGTQNLPVGYRSGSTRLMLASELPLQNNVNLYGVIEGPRIFENIYPRLNAGTGNDPGKVTAISGYFQFTDTNLDFDVNQYLTDATAKVVFTTGELAGYQFEIASYNHSTKTFIINAASYENAIELPSADFHAVAGDKYVLIDIIMPPAYVTGAEAELLAKGTEYLPTCSNTVDNYTADCDPLYFKTNNITIALGQVIRLVSAQLGIDKQKRVIGFNQNLNQAGDYKLNFGEVVTGRIDGIESDVASVAKLSTSSGKTLTDTDYKVNAILNSSARRYSDQKGTSKRIKDLGHASAVADTQRLEVDNPTGDGSEYIAASELAEYIKAKLGVTIESTRSVWDRSMHITGNLTASQDVIAYVAGAVTSDVLASLTASAPLRKSSNSNLVLDYNTSQFETASGLLQIKSGILAPAAHNHAISDVTGLQSALDGKLATRTFGTAANSATTDFCASNDARLSDSRVASDVYSWAKAGTKPSYRYDEISDANDIVQNSNTTIRKTIVSSVIGGGVGYRSQIGLGSKRSTTGFGDGVLSVGLDDSGASFQDYLFSPGGRITSGAGTFAYTTEIPTTLPASDVYAWAKAATKPSYVWSEIGSKPTWESKFGWDVTNSRVTLSTDLYITGNLLASADVIAYVAGAVSSDVLASLTATAPLRKSSNSNLVLDYNTSQFETASGLLQIKSGVLAPAAHNHAIRDVTGLQSALDGKLATRTFGTAANSATTDFCASNDARLSDSRVASDVYSWAKAGTKPSYRYDEISDANDIVQNANTTIRKTIVSSVIGGGVGYRSQIGLGSKRSTTGFGDGVLSVGLDDSGASFQDYLFSPGGRITSGAGTFAYTSELPTTLPASDVYSWAKAGTKPSYTWSEIGSRPTSLSQFTNDLGNYGSFVTGTPWTSIGYWYANNHPTTLSGYGITDTPWTNYLPLSGGTLTGAVNNIIAAGTSFTTRALHIPEYGFINSYGYNFIANGSTGYLNVFGLNNSVQMTTPILSMNRADNSVMFGGAATAAGEITAYSDMRLKRILQPTKSVLDLIDKVQIFDYYRTDINPEKLRTGLGAQQLRQIFPQYVSGVEAKEMLSVNYAEMVSISLKGIQELREENRILRQRVIQLEQQENIN